MKKALKLILIVTVILVFFFEAAGAVTTMSVKDDGTSTAITGEIGRGKLVVDKRLFPYTGVDSKPSVKSIYINQSISAYIREQKIEATIHATVPKDGYEVKYYRRDYNPEIMSFVETEIGEAVEVGDYKMVVTGKGSFSGELECLFNIYPLPARSVNPAIKSIKKTEAKPDSKPKDGSGTKSSSKGTAKDTSKDASKDSAKDSVKNAAKDAAKGKAKAGEEEPEELTLMFTGDLMCKKLMQDGAYKKGGYNFKSTFKYAKKVFSEADFVVGNLETLVSGSMPLNSEYDRMQGRPFLNAPIEYLEALGYAGYRGLVLANNHCCDGGTVGIKETIDAVDKAGFERVGLQSSTKDKRYFMIEEKGYKVAVLAYAVYFNRNDELLTTSEQRVYLSRPRVSRIKADIKAAKKAGADYIVSYLHCGDEYSKEISARQRRYVERLSELGVNYIIGSHPHVLQRTEVIKPDGKKGRKTPCVFSMGNFVSDLKNELSKETAILKLTLTKTKKGKVKLSGNEFIPCYMADNWEGKDYVLVPKGYEDTDKKMAKEYNIKKRFKNAKDALWV